jgi:hypothetical protein
MAITVDSISISGSGGTGNTLYHNIGGEDRFLFVAVYSNASFSPVASGTLNDVAMPRYVTPVFGATSPIAVWFVANPPTGTATIKLWWQTLARNVNIIVASYNGVNQTAPMSSGTQWDNSPSAVTSVLSSGTANENEMFLDLLGSYDNVAVYSVYPTSGQNIVASITHPSQANRSWTKLGSTLVGSSGTVVGSWAFSGTTVDRTHLFGMALRPSVSAPVTSYGLQFRSYILGLG